MDGKYEEGIGGGVSQVATTVFNAAWEAGIKIGERHAHALYISRYPDGRDATVNYPDVDLKLVNDTPRWIVIKASYDESGILVRLLGAGPERRVESVAGELKVTGQPRIEREPDPMMYVGDKVVEFAGQPSREIRVERIIYQDGEVLYGASPGTRTTATRPRSSAWGRSRGPSRPRRRRRRRRSRRPTTRPGPADQPDSTSAIASASQAGMRVGRSVSAFTQAWFVHPSATIPCGSLVRSTTYSKRKRAPRRSVARTWIPELVVEAGPVQVADGRLARGRVHALLDEPLVAAGELPEVRDARDLEPHQVDGVVHDALRVGLAEAHRQVGREAEPVHRGNFRSVAPVLATETKEDRMRKLIIIGIVAALALVAADARRATTKTAATPPPSRRRKAAPSPVTAAAADEAVAVSQPSQGGGSLPSVGPSIVQTASLSISVARDEFEETIQRARTSPPAPAASWSARALRRGTSSASSEARSSCASQSRSTRACWSSSRGSARSRRRRKRGRTSRRSWSTSRPASAISRPSRPGSSASSSEANTVAAALAVQSELNRVQLELEQGRGRLDYLDDQVAFATISLEVRESQVAAAESDGGPWGIVDAWRAAGTGFVTVVGWIFVAAATIAPVVLLLALAFLAARLAGLRVRRPQA